LLSIGKIRFLTPYLLAPIVFSLTPPIAPIFPDNVIYPVIPIYCFIGLSNANDTRAEVIAAPAEGPSFPI
jgi:hypothetical protein